MVDVTDVDGVKMLENGRLRVRVTATHPRSNRRIDRQRTLPEGTTLQEAIARRDRLREEIETEIEQHIDRDRQRITLADYAETWIDRRKRRVAASTAAKEERILAQHILPDLGHLYVDAIRRPDVQQWARDAEGKTWRRSPDDEPTPYSDDSLKDHWKVICSLLRDAHADGHLDADPTYRVERPQSQRTDVREKSTMTRSQLVDFIRAAGAVAPGRYAEIVTVAYTGMRASELYALHWEDVDFDASAIYVRHSIDAETRERGPTKNGQPRTPPMAPIVERALTEHRRRCLEHQAPGFDEGIVFPSDVGTYRYPSSPAKALRRVAAEIGLDFHPTLQTLRFTFNSLMVESVDRSILQSIMGHGDDRMTDYYARIPIEAKSQAVGSHMPGAGGDVGPAWDPTESHAIRGESEPPRNVESPEFSGPSG